MKKICVLTATRAEYGLLKPILYKFNKMKDVDLKIVVTGAHLSPEFGLTYNEIIEDGFLIDKKIEILVSADTPSSISKSMGLALISFADYFDEENFDMLIVLGDRYEALAVTIAAMNQKIPVAHLYGGESTEGAIDESIRHAITKMSYLHFTSTEEYRNRVIQLGESPQRVFNVGALGVINIRNMELMTKDELSKSIEFELDKPYAVVTFHPVTLENQSAKNQIEQLLKALEKTKDMLFIFTKSNADADGRVINTLIDKFVQNNNRCIAETSLGAKKYLSALKYSTMVIGNSSSGILEAPSFNIPTINIGDRQKGRIQSKTIINCLPNELSILNAIEKANSDTFRQNLLSAKNPYDKNNIDDEIISVIIETLNKKNIDIKKKFYDI